MTTAEGILSQYDPEVSKLGFQLRELLLKELKEIIAYSDGPTNIIGYGFGPGYKQLLCTIIPCKLQSSAKSKIINLKSKIKN
jgi:hypothetical protein